MWVFRLELDRYELADDLALDPGTPFHLLVLAPGIALVHTVKQRVEILTLRGVGVVPLK